MESKSGRLIRFSSHQMRTLRGAKLYGPPLEYKLLVPAFVKSRATVSVVSVRFSELPIQKWHHFSNEKKNDLGIAKNAGVSIVRAGREIDYGWYFMGTKRKENYDDWWRCEVAFTPELDELFGVTHSKQKINPTRLLSSILTPEIERIARELNSRARKKYASIKGEGTRSRTLNRLQARDHLLEPPRSLRESSTLQRQTAGTEAAAEAQRWSPRVTLRSHSQPRRAQLVLFRPTARRAPIAEYQPIPSLLFQRISATGFGRHCRRPTGCASVCAAAAHFVCKSGVSRKRAESP